MSVEYVIEQKPLSYIGEFNNIDINFAKYYKAVQRTGKLVLGRVVIDLFKFESDNNSKELLKDFCVSSLGFTHKKLRSIFKREYSKLNFKIDEELEGDVSFCFKIIQEIFTHVPEVLKEKIRLLKTCRNVLCHEETEIDDDDLIEKLDHLKALCSSILTEIHQITGIDNRDLINEIESELDKLGHSLDNTLISDDRISYKQFFENNTAVIIREGRKELKSIYSKLEILNPCCWLNDSHFQHFSVENVFTELELSTTSEEISFKNLLNTKDTRFVARLVLLSGLAGSGKSSLLKYLLCQWSLHLDEVHSLKEYDLIIYINLGNIRCNSLQNFLQEDLLPKTLKHMKSEEIINIMQNINLLFLLDAYDEGTLQSKIITKEIFDKFSSFSKIIITTRPEYIIELKLLDGNHQHIKVCGFNAKSVKEYAEKVMDVLYPSVDDKYHKLNTFLSYLFSVGKCLEQSLYLPLNIALLLVLWNFKQDMEINITTSTRLYEEIFKMCKLKLIWKLKENTTTHQLKLESSVESWFENLCFAAWKLLLQDKLTLPDKFSKELMTSAANLNLNEIQTLSSFLNCEISETYMGPTYHFSFLHNSVEEFLAAKYFVSMILKYKKESRSSDELLKSLNLLKIDSSSRTLNMLRLKEMIIYSLGILSTEGDIDSSVAHYLINDNLVKLSSLGPNSTKTWYRIVTETSGDVAAGQIVAQMISSKAEWNIYSHSRSISSEMYLHLLKSTAAMPRKLVIEIDYDQDISVIPNLKDLIQLIAVNKTTSASFYFQRQYNLTDNPETMDDIVLPLLSCNLVEDLMGHGEANLIKTLRYATNISSLYLRISSVEALNQLSYLRFSSYASSVLRDLVRGRRSSSGNVQPKQNLYQQSRLTLFELFVDIPAESLCFKRIPTLKFDGKLTIKFSNVREENVKIICKFISEFHTSYSNVIFMNSTVTLSSVKYLIKESHPAKICQLNIYSRKLTNEEKDDLDDFNNKHTKKIRWQMEGRRPSD